MSNEKFDEALARLDSREFSDLTDKELDNERSEDERLDQRARWLALFCKISL